MSSIRLIFFSLLLLAVSTYAWGQPDTISTAHTSIEKAGGGIVTLTLYSRGTDTTASWTIHTTADTQGNWFSVSPTTGHGVGRFDYSVSFQDLYELMVRTGTITIRGTHTTPDSIVLPVTQSPASPLQPISPNSWYPGYQAEFTFLYITFHTIQPAWRITSNQTWLTTDTPTGVGSGVANAFVTDNISTSNRTGTFTFVCDTPNIMRTITVTQSGRIFRSLSASPTGWTVPNFQSASTTVRVTIGTGTTAMTWTDSTDSPWLSCTPILGNGTGNISVIAQMNPDTAMRFGWIFITGAGTAPQMIGVQINQPGRPLMVFSQHTWNTDARAGNDTFNISYTAPTGAVGITHITSTAGWLIPNFVEVGNPPQRASARVTANDSGHERTGFVIVDLFLDTFRLADTLTVIQSSQLSIKDQFVNLLTGYLLKPAFPNPFNATTTIRYALPIRSAIILDVINTSGQVVTTLTQGIESAGERTAILNGEKLSSSVYFVRLRVDSKVFLTKVMLIR